MTLDAMITGTLVCANGDCSDDFLAALVVSDTTRIVAVDGGLRHCRTLGREPDLLVGDLDSISKADRDQVAASKAARIVAFNSDKDETDLELALSLLTEEVSTPVTLIGLEGGRLDQALGNFLLLGSSVWPFRVTFLGQSGCGQLITPEHPCQLELPLNTSVSLLPLCHDVHGVRARGLRYVLDDETLHVGSPRGISNCVTQTPLNVSVTDGSLLLVTPGLFDVAGNAGK